MCGPKEEATGGLKKLYNEQFQDLCSLRNVVSITKSGN